MSKTCFRRTGFVCMMLLMLWLCGCEKRQGEEEASLPNDVVAAQDWKDNSLDAYSARYIVDMRPSQPEAGFSYGGWNLVLTENKAYVLQKHLCMDDYTKSWDELVVADETGKVDRSKVALPFTPDNNNQIVRMGSVFGSNHLICANAEEGEHAPAWRVFELDENLEPQWDFVARFLNDEEVFPEGLLRDGNGNVHMVFRPVREEAESWMHYVADKEGNLLYSHPLETELNGVPCTYEIFFAENGEILIKRILWGETWIWEEVHSLSAEDGMGGIIFSRTHGVMDFTNYPYFLMKDDTVYYADETGVYQRNKEWRENEEATLLYSWENHGIAPLFIMGLRARRDGSITVFVRETDGDRFLTLEPTKGESEIKEITFAVKSHRKSYFQKLVNAFNKNNPAWHITVKTDYYESRLLAELGSGDGPVLVDTLFTGYEQQEKLWEPLDDFISRENLNNELFEQVLELCKVNGVTYGLAMDFTVKTLITGERVSQDDWTYEYFFDAMERGNYDAIFPPEYLNDSRMTLMSEYLSKGWKDNYLINVKEPHKCIDEEKLTRALNLADKYGAGGDLYYDWRAAFQRGEVLCTDITLSGVTAVTYAKVHYGNDFSYVGYPADNGGRHRVTDVYPIAIRKTASEEEKEIAKAFLLYAMSYEGQLVSIDANMNFGITVRKDLFEDQVKKDVEDYLFLIKADEGKEQAEKMRAPLNEDAECYKKLVYQATADKPLPSAIDDILWNELKDYFGGNITREQLYDHLRNRIGLYLNEQL